jgi:hypothetical protein
VHASARSQFRRAVIEQASPVPSFYFGSALDWGRTGYNGKIVFDELSAQQICRTTILLYDNFVVLIGFCSPQISAV